MAGLPKRWQLLPPAPQDFLSTLHQIHPLLGQALYHRGLQTATEARHFLEGHLPSADPFRLAGVSAAVSRIRQAIKNNELTCIYGDFDADGVAGCALLVQTLTSLGGNAVPYIPHRVDEGYGLNIRAMDKLAEQGVKLVVTVDCGVRSVEEVQYAQRRGMDVIITDHHSLPEELPEALAVVNPRLPNSQYPEKNLSGVGVAYKLAQALLRVELQVPMDAQRKTITEEDLLDLVALGTVADLAPLKGENRALVKQGIEEMRSKDGPSRPGLR
ncbi:MAG: DHH family phosphoesterase, partial [Chloroflexi bacterium]|nr:DHH family phosphoesterase [Chloroflexota bacterium]